MKILVTGGAGFIGSHLVANLVKLGHAVRVLDALVAQVHNAHSRLPAHWSRDIEFQHADVTHRAAWHAALQDIDVVYHLAAEVGVGQSMYEIVRYLNANTIGTAILLELVAAGNYRVKKLIVASSMSVYGEGAYRCTACGSTTPSPRN